MSHHVELKCSKGNVPILSNLNKANYCTSYLFLDFVRRVLFSPVYCGQITVAIREGSVHFDGRVTLKVVVAVIGVIVHPFAPQVGVHELPMLHAGELVQPHFVFGFVFCVVLLNEVDIFPPNRISVVLLVIGVKLRVEGPLPLEPVWIGVGVHDSGGEWAGQLLSQGVAGRLVESGEENNQYHQGDDHNDERCDENERVTEWPRHQPGGISTSVGVLLCGRRLCS